jgi:hypothetical protein
MKPLLPRDIPRRAAVVVVVLALIASVVAGREEPSADPQTDRARESASPPTGDGPAPQSGLPDLDLDKLNRAARNNKITDLFASKASMPAPPPAVAAITPPPPPPPPAPTPPPLPFRYFGKWVDGEKMAVFLWKDNEGHSASAGDTLDGTYRIESITDSSVNFIYLPLGSKQALPITHPD